MVLPFIETALLEVILKLAIFVTVLQDLFFYKSVTYNDGGCQLIPGIRPGSEDIIKVNDDLLLVSAGDLKRILYQSGDEPRLGAIFALNPTTLQANKVPLVGYPDNLSFNPHGITYSETTNRVYAVSHECGARQSESIEIFAFSQDPLQMVHERSLRSPSFPLGTLNNVIEGTFLGEVYVTKWLAKPISDNCRGNGGLFDEVQALFLTYFDKTGVFRCLWDPNKTDIVVDTIQCNKVASGFRSANGIAANSDLTEVYVTDSLANELRVFDRSTANGALTYVETFELPGKGTADNIVVDDISGKLTIGTSTFFSLLLKQLRGDDSVEVGGGMVSVDLSERRVEQVLLHDGTKLSGISSAVFAQEKIFLGSPSSDGVLVCPIPA